MVDGVLPAFYCATCQRNIFIEAEDVEFAPLCFHMFVCDIFVRLSSVWQTGKSIRACWGCSYIILCFKYESHSRYRCPPLGIVRWNTMEPTAAVTRRHTLSYTNTHADRQPNYSVSLPFSPWLMQTFTHMLANTHKPRQGDLYFHMQILGAEANLLFSYLFAFFSPSWLSHLPRNQMMVSQHLTHRQKSPRA